ncbi:MAG: ABC transporter ATP-binding protein [Planctomycetota bacterium]
MLLETRGLTKLYGRTVGVLDLEFTVEAGEIFGFLGPNGAGKSTTIRLLLDLIRPTRGSARIFGLDTRRDAVAIRTRIGNLPGEVDIWRDCTGAEVLDFFARLRGRRVPLQAKILERFELTPAVLARKLRDYSRGMKQKIGLAVALQHAPPFLLLDEPTTALDPLVRESLFQILLELRAAGHTILFSSHNLSEVEQICDRVAILRAGRLVLLEQVATLRARRVRIVDALLKDPAAPLPGELADALMKRHGARIVLRVQGDIQMTLAHLASLGVDDLLVTAPPLEEVFLDFYRGNHGDGGEA